MKWLQELQDDVMQFVYRKFKWVVLMVVFWIGLGEVTVIHIIYMGFFCMFFVWSHVAKRHWMWLVVYIQVDASVAMCS